MAWRRGTTSSRSTIAGSADPAVLRPKRSTRWQAMPSRSFAPWVSARSICSDSRSAASFPRWSHNDTPDLVRKIILAGTGPAGGEGIANVGAILQDAFGKAGAGNKHPKQFLFFTQTGNGQAAAGDFLRRLKERTKDLDAPVSNETVQAQVAAIQAWGKGDAAKLATVQHPVLVANGDDDVMVPSSNSFELARRLPNAQLSIFPDAGHGGIFQYHAAFVQQAIDFLQAIEGDGVMVRCTTGL